MHLSTRFHDPLVTFNYLEALLWVAVAAALAVRARRAAPRYRAVLLAAGAVFIAFGGSDVVEAQTGAWYRPAWLAAWKVGCVVCLAICFWGHRRIEARSRPTATASRPESRLPAGE